MARAAVPFYAGLAWLAVACSGDTDPKTTDSGTTDTDTDTGTIVVPGDGDGDGVPAPDDCDDADPNRFPGNVEHCDGVDNNCDDTDEEVGIITVMPDQTFATLQEASDVAAGGETVQICPGTYLGATTFTVPITLVGVASPDPGTDAVVRPILDGDGGGTTLRLQGAGSRVEGLAITGGTDGGIVVGLDADAELVDLDVYDNIGQYGAGIQFSPEGGSLEASTVHDNIAQEDGGGVYAGGTVTLSQVDITGNVAGNWGGGVTVGAEGALTLADVAITDNTAERGGGLFALANTSVVATGTTLLEGNNASASGGGAYLFTADWVGGSFVGNSAVDTGGGLYVYDGGSVTGASLEGNDATRGGGMFAAGLVTLDALSITGNEGETDGGGIYLLDANATLSGSTVDGNHAPDGGGIYLQDSSIVDGVVSGNTADNGGGVFVSNVEDTTVAVIDGTRIEDNEATTSGGGLYLPDDTDLVDVLVLRNLSGDRAGGIYVTNEAEIQIDGALVQSNTAVQRGGGIYANTISVVDLSDTELSRNQALRGAGLYINNDSTVQFTDSTVRENGDATTVSGGGARLITGDLVSITSDWGEGPQENTPDDVYTEQMGAYIGYSANATFACDAYGCSPEP